tara:strand:+ start:134470 stop:134859 length:390 start_codon:yes stop_codon:yes gene_type:complete
MAISPKQLIESYENPKLSDKDQKSIDNIEKEIDKDIMRSYGYRYNAEMDFIPDGFTCEIYMSSKFRGVSFSDENLSKAYLINVYRKIGWEIELGDNWKWIIKFSRAALRDNIIDDLLGETDNDDNNKED